LNRALDLSLRLTAIALLLRPMGPWYVRPVVLAAASLTLTFPRLLRNPAVWCVLAIATFIRIADDWPLADNHIYLLGYWCLANAIALRDDEPAAALAQMGRWLLGLAFAFAVLWKVVLSPDYLDGRFFRVTLLTDPRLVEPAMLLGGLTADDLERSRKALDALPEGAELRDPPSVVESGRFRTLSAVSTWGVLVHEAAIAASMLLPSIPFVLVARHALLLSFCAITYAFAPVAGFGWLLLVIGLAQAPGEKKWLRLAYVAAFLLVLFYSEVPWPELLTRLLS
jgi:hypothetical protein